MKFTTVQKAFLALIVTNIIWGAAAPIFKVSLTNIPPFTLAFWRFLLGALILLAFLRKKAKIPTKSRKDLKLLVWYALSGITVNIMFFFWGLRLTQSINAPLIASGAPILTFFLAIMFLGEHFKLKKFTGMILGTIGILLIIVEPIFENGIGGSPVGNIFLVIATLAAVIQTIIGKQALPRFEPFAFTFWAFIIGAASFFPLALYEYGTIPQLYQHLNINGFMGIVYGAIFASAAGYSLYAWGLSKIQASDASLFTYIDPIVGALLSVFVLKEQITPYYLAGGVLIFGGIFIAEGRLHYHPFHKFLATNNTPSDTPLPPIHEKTEKRDHVNRKEVIEAIYHKETVPQIPSRRS